MAKAIKVRASVKNGLTTVKALMSHPMKVGGRDKKTGKEKKPHFIQTVTCEHNGKAVLTAEWSAGISANPYLSFKFKGANKGDTLKVSWVDNEGKSATLDAKIK